MNHPKTRRSRTAQPVAFAIVPASRLAAYEAAYGRWAVARRATADERFYAHASLNGGVR